MLPVSSGEDPAFLGSAQLASGKLTPRV